MQCFRFWAKNVNLTLEHILWLPRESGQTYPVVIRTEIDYRRAAKLGDRLVIEGWLDQVEHVRFWCGFRITRPQDHMLIGTCRQMLALVEMPPAKLWPFA